MTGIALFIAAAIVMALAWSAQKSFLQSNEARVVEVAARPPAAASTAIAPTPAPVPELPPASDVPLLLTQMKQAAVSNGLDWRAAEYRITAATPTQPAVLEVRCSLKGPYPKLRSMLVQLKEAVPAFTIREFSVSRPNADIADVEAKLALAVFLQDGALASDATPPTVATKGSP